MQPTPALPQPRRPLRPRAPPGAPFPPAARLALVRNTSSSDSANEVSWKGALLPSSLAQLAGGTLPACGAAPARGGASMPLAPSAAPCASMRRAHLNKSGARTSASSWYAAVSAEMART